MMRLLLLIYGLTLTVNVWGEQGTEQSDAVREIQQLDQSRLEFDFFEESDEVQQPSDEESLLQALELLEQSSHGVDQEQLDPELGVNDHVLSLDAETLPDDMDEEIDTNLEQELSEELLEEFEEQFNEDDFDNQFDEEDLQEEFEDDAESFIEDQLEFFDEE
mgnify:CR=1 FL=1